jgi:hypothetical protein
MRLWCQRSGVSLYCQGTLYFYCIFTLRTYFRCHYYNTSLYQRSVILYSNGQTVYHYCPVATVVSQYQ